ncbi:MAG: ADP-ribosylglycohydrolase family protein [Oscillatoriales cyanobacterium RU_3_3]|nr:ADP-ribosylglycohydrolase family protein [Oscillatoriales cyanobacterium RU_3_3]NJR25726.1 ADP-ribosylglycohydrolase family protein [Richelia sp. CSU_2_1]
MLLELAIGDAYGAGFEFVDRPTIELHNNLKGYLRHPHHDIEPGCYTDDTQMSLAVAEAIISQEPWTPELLASKFVGVFKRDRRVGYAGKFYDFLLQVKNGKEFLEKIHSASDKSGAAMRSSPIGIFPTVEQVIEKATVQAAITHNTIDGINAARAAALMSHYFIYQLGSKQDLGKFLENHVSGEWSIPWQGKVSVKGLDCVKAAITAVMRNDRLSAILQDCINFSGDVDTVATIALAAASCSREIVQDLPENLLQGLENLTYGRDYIRELDKQLMNLIAY